MMAKIKHTATLPDGRIVKRTSASRTYSHCVAVQKPAEMIRAWHREAIASQQALAVSYRETAALVATGGPARSRGAVATFRGAELAETWIDFAETAEARARLAEEALATVTDGDWGVIGWNSRFDLAEKEAARWLKRGYRVQILEAEVTS